MNIFILDEDPHKSAMYHADIHISKMILEAAQMLCTAVNLSGGKAPYKSTHEGHPCSVWVRASKQNALYLVALASELNQEKIARFNSGDHKSYSVIRSLLPQIIERLPDLGLLPFVQCVPDEFKRSSTVSAYCAYYRDKARRMDMKWTLRGEPYWWRFYPQPSEVRQMQRVA